MTFGEALIEMKSDRKVARAGWNGKGMWIARMSAGTFGAYDTALENCPALVELAQAAKSRTIDVGPFLVMKTADGSVTFGWLASQADMLADDWTIVP